MKARLALAALAALALLAPAARADETIGAVERVTPMSAYGGRLVWSEYVPAANAYKLMTRVGGVTSEVPVPTSPRAFDVDLGPGPDGAVTATYTRCEPRCTIRLLSFEGAPREVSVSNTSGAAHPTLWRSRVAYAIGSRLYVRTIGGSAVRYRGGPRRYEISDLDLYGRRLAAVWRNRLGEGHREELRLASDQRSVRTVARASSGALSLAFFTGPAFARGALFAVRVRLAEAGNRFLRYGLRSGELDEVRGRANVLSAATDGSRFFFQQAGGDGTGECPCPLVVTDPIAFP